MWWVKTNSSGEDRGGFQNRDSGRSAFNKDYGPDFGVDYARFSDPPDTLKDMQLKELLTSRLQKFENDWHEQELTVRNGFIIMKGHVRNDEIKKSMLDCVHATEGVKEVIHHLHVFNSTH